MSIEERIAKLEESNRRLRFSLIILMLIIVGAGVVLLRGDDGVVRTTELQVVDDRGNAVVRIKGHGGFGHLVTYGPQGKPSVAVTGSEKGHGVVAVHGVDGDELVRLSANQGEPLAGVITTMSAGRERIGMGTGDGGVSAVVVFDGKGELLGVWPEQAVSTK